MSRSGSPDASRRLREGDVVRVWMDRPGSSKRRSGPFEFGQLQILFEDDLLLVVNKPAGILSVPLPHGDPTPSVYALLEDHLRGHRHRRPFVVHRIDRDTSGLVLFAKTSRAQETLKDQFRRREPERVYLALVYGHPTPPAGTWRDVLVWDKDSLIQRETHPSDPRGKEAVAHYRVVETLADTVAHRGEASHREAESDSHPGAPARSYARWRAAIHLWAGRDSSDRFSEAGAARASARCFSIRPMDANCVSRRRCQRISQGCSSQLRRV